MTRKSIVIADDDRDLLELMALHCRGLGLDVHTAGDSLAALLTIEQQRPDLVILDVQMPSGSGLGVLEMLAENEELKRIPVIILTGRASQSTVRRCHDACAYYVPKCPDCWSRLEPLVRELLELQPAAGALG